ncbi:MAG: tryptophan synthase subunit alpha [Acidiferrobacterales bacterium]
MSRITQRFEALKGQGRKALVPFVTAGDPDPKLTVPLLHALAGAGADILELGVPFSDPMADGPVIQRASERALSNGVTLRGVLEMIRDFRSADSKTPIVLMGYLNPFEIMGYRQFAEAAATAGADGVITVDVPPEEATDFAEALRANDLDPIFLLSPTSSNPRIRLIAEAAGGFLYYVSLRGVTGASHLDVSAVASKLKAIRAQTTLPVGVGFGIHSPETAAAVAGFADAVVVGSALVKRIGDLVGQRDKILTEIPDFVASLRNAMDQVGAAA